MSKILLIDDDPDIHRIMAFLCQKINCQLLQAHNGREGEQLAKQANPDLILLDIMMPLQNGYETCQHLRSQGYQGAISMVSALHEATGTKKAQECGANGYMLKPLDASLLELHLAYSAFVREYPTVTQWLASQK